MVDEKPHFSGGRGGVVGVRTCFYFLTPLTHSLSQGTTCTIIGMGIGRMPKRFPRRGFTISLRQPRIFERGTKFISATTNVTDATIDSMNMEPRVRYIAVLLAVGGGWWFGSWLF